MNFRKLDWISNLHTTDTSSEPDDNSVGIAMLDHLEEPESGKCDTPTENVPTVAPENPSDLGYPATLPVEIALNMLPVADICTAYNISTARWLLIKNDPVFQQQLEAAKDMLKKEGMSFQLKAKLQSEELLRTTWNLIHSHAVPPNVKADLIKSTIRWAGYEAQASSAAISNGSGFSININFSGGSDKGRVIDGN